MSSRLAAVVAAGCVALAAAMSCDSGTDPVSPESLDGVFELVAVNEDLIPARRFELPTRNGERATCFANATRGWLALERNARTFVQVLHLEDSCGIATFGSDTIAVGQFDIVGDSLTLVAALGEGRTERLPGRVTSGSIEVTDNGTRYRYRR